MAETVKPGSPGKPDKPTGKLIAGTDMPVQGWIGRWLPRQVQPYARLMRLDRPIGTWLLLFPCWWGVAMGVGRLDGSPDLIWSQLGELLLFFVLFGLGATIMRGAGCTWNDITDRDIDALVERTRVRPIPAGEVSIAQALGFLAFLLLVSLGILLVFNWYAVAVGAASLVVVFTYPFMKRITWWPQIFLGLAFNWGALLGWAAVNGSLSWTPVVLYVAGIFWTLGYDTIYAHQDKEDDALIGVKSTARLFGDKSKPWLTLFFALALALIGVAGWMDGLGWPFWLGLGLAGLQGAWQVADVDLNDSPNCLSKFQSNRLFGWLVLAGLAGDLVWAAYG